MSRQPRLKQNITFLSCVFLLLHLLLSVLSRSTMKPSSSKRYARMMMSTRPICNQTAWPNGPTGLRPRAGSCAHVTWFHNISRCAVSWDGGIYCWLNRMHNGGVHMLALCKLCTSMLKCQASVMEEIIIFFLHVSWSNNKNMRKEPVSNKCWMCFKCEIKLYYPYFRVGQLHMLAFIYLLSFTWWLFINQTWVSEGGAKC